MAFAPIPEYEGKSPYVFITYAQQDEKIAYPIAVKMFNEGFRLWSSAACGNPSNMRIAERLSNSAVAVVFLSKSYLKYASYKEFEPRAVMSSPKQKIVICLDDTPLGTDWNTVDFPAGIRYNPDIPQELWLRINSSDALEKCRGAWPSKPMPMPFDEISTLNVNVDNMDEEELSGELNSLNSVMSSFGAGLDDEDIKNITLFQKKKDNEDDFKWQDKIENTQEQEYYAIENLIDTTPMPVPAEKKQYDNMIGLIENFMEKSNRMKESELRERISKQPQQQVNNSSNDFSPIPLSNFDNMDMAKDASDNPVMFTQTTPAADNNGFTPIVIDYGDTPDDSAEPEGYSMTRNATGSRSERFSASTVFYPSDDGPHEEEDKSSPVFETIVDDRKFITSTEDNAADARLTYHLGILDSFDEKDYIQEEKTSEPKPELKFEPVDTTPVQFTYADEIPQPALSFAKREAPQEPVRSIKAPRRVSVKYRRRWKVAVRTRINHIEYGNEMYKVNGRWIPSEIYHTKMPNAKYTAVKNIAQIPEPAPSSQPNHRQSDRYRLDSDSRLFNAVNTFRSPAPQRPQKTSELISESLRSAMRERHELRRAEAIRQAENDLLDNSQQINAAVKGSYTPAKNTEDENIPARKYKFSHEGGIKKELMAHMETPVDTDVEQSHRQYGAKAELFAAETEISKKDKKKKGEKSASDYDEDTLIAIPTYGGQPKINYDPSAYCDMNLSEILFGDTEKPKHSKKKKKK